MSHFADWLENTRQEHHLSEDSLESIVATVAKVLDAVRVQAHTVIADVDAFVKKVSRGKALIDALVERQAVELGPGAHGEYHSAERHEPWDGEGPVAQPSGAPRWYELKFFFIIQHVIT